MGRVGVRGQSAVTPEMVKRRPREHGHVGAVVRDLTSVRVPCERAASVRHALGQSEA
jgi:hypothetical protein